MKLIDDGGHGLGTCSWLAYRTMPCLSTLTSAEQGSTGGRDAGTDVGPAWLSFVILERQRLGAGRTAACVAATLAIGPSCGLPLVRFFRSGRSMWPDEGRGGPAT